MKTSLVGYTGFVGGNLAASHAFDNLYNSSNIETSFGADNGLVVYSGMPSEKFLANADPEADFARAERAMEIISQMNPEKLILISTVDVYPRPSGVYEDTPIDADNLPAYGKNRLALENWVRDKYPDALILRLPGLFGQGLKKNFIFDMLNLIPPMLTAAKYEELRKQEPFIQECYVPGEAGYYKLQAGAKQLSFLRIFFRDNDFNSLSFTDSRSIFQFYDLSGLWADIRRCLKADLHTVNLATEPVEAGALYHYLFGMEFENFLEGPPARYDMRTHFGRELGGHDDYIADRTEVVAGIAKFVSRMIGGGIF